MIAKAGTYESSDCLIQISDSPETQITIESIVFDQFGDQIKHVISDILKTHNITNVHIECFDKGALDYTIKARVQTALRRGGYLE